MTQQVTARAGSPQSIARQGSISRSEAISSTLWSKWMDMDIGTGVSLRRWVTFSLVLGLCRGLEMFSTISEACEP